jgi:hypothetical protein
LVVTTLVDGVSDEEGGAGFGGGTRVGMIVYGQTCGRTIKFTDSALYRSIARLCETAATIPFHFLTFARPGKGEKMGAVPAHGPLRLARCPRRRAELR